MSDAYAEIPPPLPAVEARPWGFWMTVLFTVLIYGVFLIAQMAAGVVLVIVWAAAHTGADPVQYAQSLDSNGDFVAVATLAAGPVCILITVVLARLRKHMTARDYFALQRPRMLHCVGWTVLTVAALFAMDYVRTGLGEALVPEIVVSWFASAAFLPLLVLAIVVAAPIVEELIFRGFMYRGLAASRVGVPGAIVLTALFWAGLHAAQYNLLNTAMIFAFGLILGAARTTSGSLYLPLFLHTLNNGISTLQIVYFAGQGGAPTT